MTRSEQRARAFLVAAGLLFATGACEALIGIEDTPVTRVDGAGGASASAGDGGSGATGTGDGGVAN